VHVTLRAHRRQVGQVALALAALALGAAIWLHAAGPGAYAGTDFTAYLTAARTIASGGNPYHRLVVQTVSTQPGAAGLHSSGYVYPPLLATVLAVLVRAGLGSTAIWLIWTALNVTALAAMGRELNLCLRGDRSWSGALAFAAATMLPALATYDLWLGQSDLLMAALVVAASGRLARGAGGSWALLGIACAVKPTMALVLLAWLWLGYWRVTLAGALAALALIAAPFALLGLPALRDYVTFTLQWNGLGADAEFINQSPNGMLLRLFTRNPYISPAIVAPWLVLPLRVAASAAAIGAWIWAAPTQPARTALGKTLDAFKRVLASPPASSPSPMERGITAKQHAESSSASLCVSMGRGLGGEASPSRQPDEPSAVIFAACLAALPLIVLLSPLSEDIHICIIIPTLVGLGYLALARGWHRWWAAWLLVAAFAVACIPRMQEIIYPDRFVPLPGQSDPRIGPIIVMARTGALLALSIAAFIGGCAVARRVQANATSLFPGG
jgi:hypothetical protein